MTFRKTSILLSLLCFTSTLSAQDKYVSAKNDAGYFGLSSSGKSTSLLVSDVDYPGVIRAAKNLQEDIGRVTNTKPLLRIGKISSEHEVVIIGTIGKSPVIDQLIKKKKLDVSNVVGKWETFLIQVIEKPMKGVDRALVIVGSDKRATIFGIYDLSKQIGISPWHFWADVPPKKSTSLFVSPERQTQGEPAVKYRGIFINDEEPALGRWAVEKYGGFNHEFYEKVFELILRMKGNYLWPAMWWASFNSDDPLNPKLADEYGIVMGTTHHEPMNRAHAEWKALKGGAWNYETNTTTLQKFWTEGIQRIGNHETIVSVGMRGDGDMAMTEETNIALLEKIVKDQRKIISDIAKKPSEQTPQLWALYKEVQDYYDKGMRVPDDVTLLLCDDNWGNNRKLPKLEDKNRAGGYGIYYHFDYVGDPRNYKWLNTNQIARTWEQMHLAYEYGADRIWIVNVGDIKPMEFPIEFFLDYAWNPKRWTADNVSDYTRLWAEEQFGNEHAASIANILTKYTTFNARRKPELLSPETYSLVNYREAETVTTEYHQLATEAEQINELLPTEYRDAYYQLVLHPTRASANLYALYLAVAKNRLYASQGRAETNLLAEEAQKLFDKDAEFSNYYNKIMAGGKWNHMMDQTHISYTYWQQPDKDVLPEVKALSLPLQSEMGVAIEGSVSWWPMEKTEAVLPEFDCFNQQDHYIEIFNRGQTSFNFTIEPSAEWIKLDHNKGTIDKQQLIEVSIDWTKAPVGRSRTPIAITDGSGKKVIVYVSINKPFSPSRENVNGFVESNNYVSMEAEHYSKTVNTNSIQWKVIPDIGRTLSGVTAFPVTAKSQTPGGDSPHLEYSINVSEGGERNVMVYVSPTLNFHNTSGLRYGISIDDQPLQIVNIHTDMSPKTWGKMVADNINITTSKHSLSAGHHTLKFWMVDSGVVLQKIVVASGELKSSYLGPPESFYQK